MEETLKLILEKISSVDKEINNKKNNMATKEDINSINKRLDKIDMVLEHQIEPKIAALFDARDVSLQSDEVIMQGVKEVKEDISHLEKAVIRNTADIVDLKDYRKEN